MYVPKKYQIQLTWNSIILSESKARTAESLVEDWNASLEETRQRIMAHNEDAIAQYKNGDLHPKTLSKMIEPLPTRLKPPSAAWCQWFRVAWGWSMYSRSSDAQAWLPFDHADMAASRTAVQSLVSEGVHPGLILNYDQIWRNNFNAAKFKVPFKGRHHFGRRARRVRPHASFDKKSHAVKGSRRSLTAT